MPSPSSPGYDFEAAHQIHDDEDQDEEQNHVELLLRKRAVAAAAQLFFHNGIDDFWTIDALLEKEEAYFSYKLRRNIRREKLQTVLKLFGFRSVDKHDEAKDKIDRVDAVLETETQALESKVLKVFDDWHYYWTVLVALVEMWYLLAIPFRCCFEFPRGIYSLVFEALLCDSVVYVNILIRCFLPREVAGVAKWQGVNEDYVWSFWFFYDVVANLPLDYLGLILGSNCTLAFNRCDLLAPYWQLNRILNVRGFIDTTMEVIESILQKFHIHPYAALVVIVTIVQAYFWHLFACFLFVDVIRRGPDFELIRNLRVNDTNTKLIDAPIALQYAASLDWSSKVLAGWDRGSDFALDTWTFAFNAVSVAFGLCLMTTFVSFVSGLVEMETPYINQTMDIDMIIDVVDYKRCPNELRDEMVEDSWYRYESKTHMLQASHVLGDLPHELHDRLLHFEGQRVLGRVKLFAPLLQNDAFVISVAKQLKPCIMAPHEILFEKGETGESMYFLVDGRLGVVDADFNVKFVLEPGMFVGEIALLLGAVRTATVVVLDNFVRMLSLNKKDFEILRRKFPNTFAQVHQKARDRWMELNQPLLDKAKAIGKKEVEEIAKRRFKLAQMKIHNVVMASEANVYDNDAGDGDGYASRVDDGRDIEKRQRSQEEGFPDGGGGEVGEGGSGGAHQFLSPTVGGASAARKRSASNADVFATVIREAQLKEVTEHHHQNQFSQRRGEQHFVAAGENREERLQRKAASNLAEAMFGVHRSSTREILSGEPSPDIIDPNFRFGDQVDEDNDNDNDDNGEQRQNVDASLVPNAEPSMIRETSSPSMTMMMMMNGSEARSPLTSNVEAQVFGVKRNDSQTAFLKQFLKDTMRAHPVPMPNDSNNRNNNNNNNNMNDDDGDYREQQQQQRELSENLHLTFGGQRILATSDTSVVENNTSTADRDSPPPPPAAAAVDEGGFTSLSAPLHHVRTLSGEREQDREDDIVVVVDDEMLVDDDDVDNDGGRNNNNNNNTNDDVMLLQPKSAQQEDHVPS